MPATALEECMDLLFIITPHWPVVDGEDGKVIDRLAYAVAVNNSRPSTVNTSNTR